MTIPFSQVKPASLKMKVLPRYPAAFRAGPGIAIAQANGIVTTSVDFANMERDDNTPLDGLYVGAWDATDNLFKLVLANWLKGDKGDQGNPGPANASDYETLALAEASTISAPVMYLRIAGFYAAGDGGHALYKRVASIASGVHGLTSADGAKWQLAESVVSVLMTGAVGDGVTDDVAAFQLAVTSAYVLGGIVELPNRPFHWASRLDITQSVTIRGMGQNANSNIYMATGIHGIFIDTPQPVELRDFSMAYPSAAASGTAAIVLTSSTSQNSRSRISNVYIANAYDGIFTGAACLWIIEKCYFSNIGNDGITVQNTYQVDSGDSVIEKNTFAGIALAAIYYGSSSGLRVINNKINGATYGLLMRWDGTQSHNSTTNNPGADLWVSNNSIEGITDTSVYLSRADTSSAFGVAIISDNELSGPRGLLVAATSTFLIDLGATGNIMYGDTANAATGFLLQYVRGYLISNNLMQSQHAGSIIVNIDATNSEGVVGPNARFAASSFVASVTSGTSSTTISPT